PFGVVGDANSRARIFPDQIGTNVSVSGADVSAVLTERSDADSREMINDEIDLVLYPRQLSQIEYVESVIPDYVLCWIGANDALGAALDFNALDASQLTPLAEFQASYTKIATRLGTLISENGTKVVFANVPDITSIGFLVDDTEAERFLGFPVDLPEGSYTSIVALFLMSFAGNDDVLADPGFVLDIGEIADIQTRIGEFNEVIQARADDLGMPVVDINQWFKKQLSDPPEFFGIPLRKQLLGGLFSLDGVHPSNISHALVANEFIETMNDAFSTKIPRIRSQVLSVIFLLDPSIDKDRDGKAKGRLGVGLLESVAFLAGITGDRNDFAPD
ncbi:MAG: SGNH/GDSL hydrolase family protein, partial [Thiohalocapsa sp.]